MITLDELKERVKNYKGRSCNSCGNELDLLDKEIQHSSKGKCSDCYYGELGNEIEKFPIINPIIITR